MITIETEHSEMEPKKNVKMANKNYEDVFTSEYIRLNAAQKKAVDTIEGPVLVVAGPGTGKTQVLALRTAKILLSTQMRPHNILCLTFSKSGATAMRSRLRDCIGSDAYGITVNTIHGFCNEIIQSYPSVFEDWSALQQISDVERYRLLNTIIDQLLPKMVLVHPKSPYSRTKDILGRIAQLKREGVTEAETLQEIAREYALQMQSKSKEGTKVHERNLLSAKKFYEFIRIFHAYQEALEQKGLYDYEDMILNVTKVLQQEEWLLASLQERYQYILVDEFQDTNGAQYSLIETLTHDPSGDNAPNFFVVGDDDQAIYRFQGANLTNILSFCTRFPKAPVIALTESYRCTQPILDAAESLISQNTERLVGKIDSLDKHLHAVAQQGGQPPTMLFAASDMAEPWMIADCVDERLRAGIDPSDIAVIVQTNRELLHIYDVFAARQIPTILSGKLNLLEHPLVEQALAIIKAIENPTDDYVFATALASSCFACHPADLSSLYSTKREQNISLLEYTLQLEQVDLSLRNPQALLAARDTILDLHHKKDQRTVVQTLEHIYTDTHLLSSNENNTMDIVDFAAAQEFFDRIKSRAHEQHHFTFSVFLDDLEYYKNADYSDLRLTYDLPHLTKSGVQLMTAHKSKGLEFHTVIITNFREGHWDKRRNPASVSIPEDLLFGWEKDQKTFEKNQDERRVAFVAMTRAKRELLFTCPQELTTGDSMQSVSPSGFFAEAGQLPEQQREVLHPDQMSTILLKPIRQFDAEFEAFLHKRIEKFSLSATALNHFLEDPQLFLEQDLLQKPQAKAIHFAYGNALHHVLAKWSDGIVNGVPRSKEDLCTLFDSHLQNKEILTPKERERLSHLGHETIERYFSERLQPPYPIIHKVEYSIKAHLGEIPLKGKIDRIDLLEPNSMEAAIIDFKTGKPKSPKEIIDYGYYRQLVFYDVLIRNGYSAIEPKEFRLEFVGEREEGPNSRIFTISEEEREDMRKLIVTVWNKILALDFTPIE